MPKLARKSLSSIKNRMRAAITGFIYVKQERQGGEPIKLYCKKSRYLNNYFSQLSLFITRNKPVRGLKTENSRCH